MNAWAFLNYWRYVTVLPLTVDALGSRLKTYKKKLLNAADILRDAASSEYITRTLITGNKVELSVVSVECSISPSAG